MVFVFITGRFIVEGSETEEMAVVSCWCCRGCCMEDGADETPIPPIPNVALEAVGDDEGPKCLLGIASSFVSSS